MPEAALLFGLLVPVALLLFLNLRMSKRLRYPHDLLRTESRKGAAAFLFRSFRTYHDVIIDAAIAVTVAFAIASASGSGSEDRETTRETVVVDCSRSMLAGIPGQRPIDLALKAAYPSDDGKDRTTAPRPVARLALAFDPSRGRTRLHPLDAILDGTTGEAAVARLSSELSFHEVDYRALGDLAGRRDGIRLLTDALPAAPEGFEAVETGFAPGFSAYPTGARYDRAGGGWLVSFASTEPPAAIQASRWDEAATGFVALPRRDLVVEERRGGVALRLPEEGLWRVALSGRGGEADSVFGFRLKADRRGAAAAGAFSRRVLAALPYLEAAGAPSVALVDAGDPDAERTLALASGPRMLRIMTTLAKTGPGGYLPPRFAGGSLVAGAALLSPGRVDLALGPAGLANEDLPLAFDGVLTTLDAPAWLSTEAAGTARMREVAGLFFVDGRGGPRSFAKEAMPVNAGAGEYFPPIKSGRLSLPRAEPPRWPWALGLALLLALKFAAWKRSSGKSLVRRSGP